MFLHPGPHYTIEGKNVTLPICHVTGYPQPVVTWSKLSGQLPQVRVKTNTSALTIFRARKNDSDTYFCSAVNLLGSVEKKTLLVVRVPVPKFTGKPPVKIFAATGETLELNCTAAGDPTPVISWKNQGSQLPVGRSQQMNGTLILRGLTLNDAGNYICVATITREHQVETVTNVEVYQPIARGCLLDCIHYLCYREGGARDISKRGKVLFISLPTHIIQDFLIFFLLNIRETAPVLVKFGQYDEVVQRLMLK